MHSLYIKYWKSFCIKSEYEILKDNKKSSASKIALAKKGIGKRRISRKDVDIEKPLVFDLTDEKKEVFNILEYSNDHVFLTGKAGTGKSNFLQYFRTTTRKKVVVVAFTGVAAINVQGQTIHSFFKFHPRTTIDTIRRQWGEDAKMYKRIDTIIIDEISMVRADLLDFIDKFMRINGNDSSKPFGGVQVFAIGDLFQLPPIVQRDEEEYFSTVYKSQYFFDSHVYQEANFIKKELTEMYRQDKDEQGEFIKALDNLRVCSFDDADIDLINHRYDSIYEKPSDEFVISLVPTNKVADYINNIELSKLSPEPRTYTGEITDDFKAKELPTAMNLELKEGAQVMLLHNDPRQRWVNGDIVKIVKTEKEYVRVLFDDGSFDDIVSNKWESIKFVLDEETDKINPVVAGTFTQLPIKLAWAVTIHKAQGKTFEKVHIEFGRGTFAPGQAYVALSRCRSLEGMTLTSPLQKRYVFTDKKIKDFMEIA